MANHERVADNYVEKKTWDEAVEGAAPKPADNAAKDKDAERRAADKGEAARNGGGDK